MDTPTSIAAAATSSEPPLPVDKETPDKASRSPQPKSSRGVIFDSAVLQKINVPADDGLSRRDGASSPMTPAPSRPAPPQKKTGSHGSLRLQTEDLAPPFTLTTMQATMEATAKHSILNTTGTPTGTPNFRSTLSFSDTAVGSSSPASTLSSPSLGPVGAVTPLPSPLITGGSPGPWKQLATTTESKMTDSPESDYIMDNVELRPSESNIPKQQKRKPYHGLVPAANEARKINAASHSRNRSISDYVTEPVHIQRPRLPTISGLGTPTASVSSSGPGLKREEYLAERRGLTSHSTGLPTPPDSLRGVDSSDSEILVSVPGKEIDLPSEKTSDEYFSADTLKNDTRRKWRALRLLGQGTFSRVVLATEVDTADEVCMNGGASSKGIPDSTAGEEVEPKRLVAVKIVEHGPAGGASEERVETSLKRELEILKSIQHPSLVHLKAYSIEPDRALLILNYCPGGDLFDLASQKHHLLSAALIRRIFAELVAATLYLHEHLIVHRDIKLESTGMPHQSFSVYFGPNDPADVLLNIPCDQLSDAAHDWQTFPTSLVTLTDLGLSRRIDPADPLLHTRCGSEDYASPELLMGQPYDGRQTDAWALGVLLYALMEGRLPFDPLPGASEQQKMRSRTVHRIARCDWSWSKFADDQGEPGEFGELEGARGIVEGLLKRASRRLPLDQVVKQDWVRDAIQVEGDVKLLRASGLCYVSNCHIGVSTYAPTLIARFPFRAVLLRPAPFDPLLISPLDLNRPGTPSSTASSVNHEPPEFVSRPRDVSEDDEENNTEGALAKPKRGGNATRKKNHYDSRIEQMLCERPELPIVIVDAGKSQESGGSYIVYTIRTGDIEVRRRYSEFSSLRVTLVNLHPTLVIPPIPEKHSMADYAAKPTKAKEDTNIIDLRKRMLTVFLNRCRRMPEVREDGVWWRFLDPNASWSEVLHSHPVSSIPKSILKAPPLDPAHPTPAHNYLPIPSATAKLKSSTIATSSGTPLSPPAYASAPSSAAHTMPGPQVFGRFPPTSQNFSEQDLDPYFANFESSTKELEQLLHGNVDKVNRRMLTHVSTFATDLAELGARYNAFSLSEQSPTLAAALERIGQAADSSFIATEELYSSLSANFVEPMRENAQFAGVVRGVLRFRIMKRIQEEMTKDELMKKKAQLESLEHSEMEAKRIDQYISSGGATGSPRKSSDRPASGHPRREGSNEDTASIDSDFPPAHGDVASTPSAAQGAAQAGGQAGHSDSDARKRSSSGGNFVTNKIFGRLSHAMHGIVDVDPERTRRDQIGKTKESIAQLEQALDVCSKDVKDASAGILKDLKRFQHEKEEDLKRYMVAFARSHIEWAKKNLETWEEARAEVDKIDVR
ncbi:MAG: Sorting nexin, cytoplasm-to-vacuole targeting pathway/endosomal sorting [Peltula sp. TS41687]|nr:MAG: Sorting nexin, cytoplasm-to-vacuole targeting pathway/endosomal sorting [Peltula sp. TS41687]